MPIKAAKHCKQQSALMSGDDLPVVLVSAAGAVAAQAIISELIDNVAPGDGSEEITERNSHNAGSERVWELSNKYYTARVRVCTCADDAPPSPSLSPAAAAAAAASQPEAHIIYLTDNECSSGAALSRRAGAAAGAAAGAGAGAGAEVRLALCACARDDFSAELREAARTHRYELVALRSGEAAPAARAGPFPERCGAARALEALHAHTWPGLRLRPRARTARDRAARPVPAPRHAPASAPPPQPAPAPPPQPAPTTEDDDFSPFQSFQNDTRVSSSSSRSSSPPSPPSPDEAECVRRAELLADALGALAAARDLAPAGGAERRLRAEQVVAAACRALGTDIDRL